MHFAAEQYQLWRVVIVGYQWGYEEEDDIARNTHDDVKPEDAVVVIVLRLLQITDGTLKTTLLQCVGYQLEDQYHGYHTIVLRIQQTTQNDAEQQAQSLLYHIIHAAPK